MNSLQKKHAGFTLLEVLVAVLIFAIVMSTLFTTFNAFLVSAETVKNEVVYTEMINNVFKRISLDLESLFVLQPPAYQKPEFNSDPDIYRFVGQETSVGQTSVSSLMFASLCHIKFNDDPRQGIARIRYYLKPNENDLYTLYRSDALPPFAEEMESCYDPVLCRDVSGFDIVYRDGNGDEYRSWDSDDPAFAYTFPESIDIKITFGPGENPRIFTGSIRLGTGRVPIE
jgi:general secretion pathway protein J